MALSLPKAISLSASGQAGMTVRHSGASRGRRPLCPGHEYGEAMQSLSGLRLHVGLSNYLPYTTLALSRDSWSVVVVHDGDISVLLLLCSAFSVTITA